MIVMTFAAVTVTAAAMVFSIGGCRQAAEQKGRDESTPDDAPDRRSVFRLMIGHCDLLV
jgi:hypothetical protein